MNTFEIAAIGLRDDVERLRMSSNNIANVSTPGHKRQVAVGTAFSTLVGGELVARLDLSRHADMSSGKLRNTKSPLDVALDPGQFLVCTTDRGDQALLRGGTFHVDKSGRLLTSSGAWIQGTGGGISVPETALSVRIDNRGHVFADDRQVNTLRVVAPDAQAAVLPLGAGLYATQTQAEWRPVADPAIHIGSSEASNVTASEEMVHVMQTMRHAESMARLMQGADDMMDKAIRRFGDM